MAVDREIHEYGGVARYVFGVKASEQVGNEAKLLTDGRNCLIITDAGVAKVGLVDSVKSSLEKEGFHVDVFAEVMLEPTLGFIKEVVNIARDKRADILVGLGGGSSMDVAKAVGRAIGSVTPLEDCVGKAIVGEGIPVITIPTTSGTAAEVTDASVIRLPEEKVKSWFENVRATVTVVDPTMVLKLPPRLTAATGMDALAHSIESALSKLATTFTQALALKSIRLISDNLRKATFSGDDLEARVNMAWATLIEGFSEGNAYCVEGHAVAHVTGPYYGIHHGEAVAIALPYCMEFNLPFREELLAEIGETMDKKAVGLPPRQAAEAGVHAVKQLIEDIGLPTKLSGVKNADIKDLSELVEIYQTNPNVGPLFSTFCPHSATTEEISKLLHNMFNGVFISSV